MQSPVETFLFCCCGGEAVRRASFPGGEGGGQVTKKFFVVFFSFPGLSPSSSLSLSRFLSRSLMMHALSATGIVDGADTLLTVCAEEKSDAVKSYVHIVVIIDVSYSMVDHMSGVKAMLKSFVDDLPEDRVALSVVVFSACAKTLFTYEALSEESKTSAQSIIDREVKAMSSTNLHEGLTNGVSASCKLTGYETKWLLITDGLPNVGKYCMKNNTVWESEEDLIKCVGATKLYQTTLILFTTASDTAVGKTVQDMRDDNAVLFANSCNELSETFLCEALKLAKREDKKVSILVADRRDATTPLFSFKTTVYRLTLSESFILTGFDAISKSFSITAHLDDGTPLTCNVLSFRHKNDLDAVDKHKFEVDFLLSKNELELKIVNNKVLELVKKESFELDEWEIVSKDVSDLQSHISELDIDDKNVLNYRSLRSIDTSLTKLQHVLTFIGHRDKEEIVVPEPTEADIVYAKRQKSDQDVETEKGGDAMYRSLSAGDDVDIMSYTPEFDMKRKAAIKRKEGVQLGKHLMVTLVAM